MEWLSYVVSKNGISTDFNKIKLILELPPPINFKGVQRFTGHTGYYRRFIYMYTDLARPLYRLLIDFVWTDECQKAYDALKRALASAPILCAPNWDLIFHVHIDASNFAIGVRVSSNAHLSCNPPIFRVPNVVSSAYEEKP